MDRSGQGKDGGALSLNSEQYAHARRGHGKFRSKYQSSSAPIAKPLNFLNELDNDEYDLRQMQWLVQIPLKPDKHLSNLSRATQIPHGV